jgi:putative CocE/NonD family hydrolase
MIETSRYAQMRIHRNIDVPMRDGLVLKANVYLPNAVDRCPVVMNFGPYGKDIHLANYMRTVWNTCEQRYPEILAASSCRYVTWEAADPEVWTRMGYACVRVDSRGSGKSPGYLNPDMPEEIDDFYDAIEWAGTADWSNGKVGLLGISYYACSQWVVAQRKPPHLAALLPWQGTADLYRDRIRQDGIFGNGFVEAWWKNTVITNQYGNAGTPYVDLETGERNTGGPALSPEELARNRSDYVADVLAHPLLDAFNALRSGDVSCIDLPTLVVANWGSLGLHLRGTIKGWQRISSAAKWLRIQTGPYFLTFYEPRNVDLQRRFFDRYLKGLDNGWEQEPPVEMEIRSVDDGIRRVVATHTWPHPRVEWQRWHFNIETGGLAQQPPASEACTTYAALGPGVTFTTEPLRVPLEFAGPLKVRLHVAADRTDADLFVTVRAFRPDGTDVVFFAATDPTTPVTQGWLRLSHRKIDNKASTPYEVVFTHDEHQPVQPGQVYEVEVCVWPASLYLPAGHRLSVSIQGQDFIAGAR